MNAPIPMAPQQNFDVGSLYAGNFLKADDLNGQTYLATIQSVERVEIPEQDGSIKPKAAITLQGWPARLLLNKTNYETVAHAYGRQSAGWLGRPLQIFPATALFGGRTVPAIRVSVPAPAAPAAAIPGAAAPAAAPVAPAAPAAAPAAVPAAVPAAPAAAPPVQAALLPPLMTAADFNDDIPY